MDPSVLVEHSVSNLGRICLDQVEDTLRFYSHSYGANAPEVVVFNSETSELYLQFVQIVIKRFKVVI